MDDCDQHDKLHFLKSALLYLVKNDSLHYIQSICSFYKTLEDKAFYFTLSIDVADLTEINAKLGNTLLNSPATAAKIFQEVIFSAIESEQLLPQCTSQSQVVVKFKVQSLPKLPGYYLDFTSDLSKYADKKRLLQCYGIITGMSILHKYTKSARFFCPQTECFGSEGNKFIRLHIPGAREAQTIRSDFKCTYCGSPLQEDISCRLLADKKIVEIVDLNAFSNINCDFQSRHQAIALHVRDELVNEVHIGQLLNVIGIPVLDLQSNHLSLEVNNILQNMCPSENIEEKLIPEPILKLYEDRKKSPWSFTLSLAYAFASEICSSGSFIHLKLGLLLSLVGTASKDSDWLDFLAVGNDTLLLHRLLTYGGEICERSVVHSAHHHLTAAISKDKDRHGSDAPFIEGGSILLASDGVCIVPNIQTLKKQTIYSLRQVLEGNHVVVDVPLPTTKQSVQQLSLPRKCSIWGFTEPYSAKKSKFSADILLNTVDQENVNEEIANAFGQVYCCEVKQESYAEFALLDQILNSAMNCTSQALISKQQFKEFIKYAKSRTVSFSDEAELLIRGYYVGSRRVRGSTNDMFTVHVSAIKAISGLAGAHAKLSLRDEVTQFDATVAILLYEEQITFRTGYSIIHVQPLVHLPDNNIQLHLGPQLDKDLLQFHQVLRHFLSTHASEIVSHTEE